MPRVQRRSTGGRLLRAGVVLSASVLVATGCTVEARTPTGSATGTVVDPAAPVRIAMITHGDTGGFWSTVRKGAEKAASEVNATLDFQASNGDAKAQAQMVEAAIVSGAQAIAVSAPDIQAIDNSLDKAIAAGIPIVTLNSGAELSKKNDKVMTHVGQSEKIAGEGAGKKLAELGAKKVICILHEQNNISLQERCDGAAAGLSESGGELIKVQVTGKADPGSTAREIGAAITSKKPDAVLTLDPDIAAAATSEVKKAGVKLATFDMSPDVLKGIERGDILFAVDQQPYLQGYLPVVFLAVAVRNKNEVDHGDVVLTGPSFVTKDNVADVAALAQQGTR